MSDAPDALFFLGSHNEVDQISPVIYKLAERRNLTIDVVLQIGVPRDDYRIEKLDTYGAVSIYSREATTTPLSRAVGTAVDVVKGIGRRMPSEIPDKIYQRYKSVNDSGDEEDLSTPGDASASDYDVVGFDWGHAGSDDRFVESEETSTIVLPHGDSPYINHQLESTVYFHRFLESLRASDGQIRSDEIPQQNYYHTYLDHDYLLFPNERTADRLSEDGDAEQVRVMGSPRYNDEWLKVLSEIAPDVDFADGESLNVVIFVRQDGYFVSETEIEYTVELLHAFQDVQTVVKEHPRDRLLDPRVAEEMENVHIVHSEVESASLVEWGDVFLDMGTTISFDPIVRGKPVLELAYCHANWAVLSEYFPDGNLHCKDDLFYAIRNFREQGMEGFYDANERHQFLEEMVTSGRDSVLDAYAALFEEAAGVSNDTEESAIAE